MAHRAKKSLGQHFLRSASAIRAIVDAAALTTQDTVLEIGPGEGVLTEALLKTGARVIAVEKDSDLIPLLSLKFAEELASGQLRLIEDDVLEFRPEDHGLRATNYKLVANIPYYITGAIFEKFLTAKEHPSLLVVLIQKEVATRIVARDGKESILSLSVKAFGTPKIMAKVPASAFRPAPKVDSAVLRVADVSQKHFLQTPGLSEDQFFKVVKAGFAHKRKMLAGNLRSIAENKKIHETFTTLGLKENARAEDIELSRWFLLAKALL